MLHYYLRQVSFPFAALVKLIPQQGRLLDIGCGFGHLIKLLATRNKQQGIYAFDVDPGKLRVTNVKWGIPRSRVKTVTLIDVLYLLSDAQKIKLLRQSWRKLEPGGKLVIAIVPKEQSWRYWLAWLQEWIMVKLLAKTQSAEKIINFETEKWLRAALRQAGFRRIKRHELPMTIFFWHRHVVFAASKIERV